MRIVIALCILANLAAAPAYAVSLTVFSEATAIAADGEIRNIEQGSYIDQDGTNPDPAFATSNVETSVDSGSFGINSRAFSTINGNTGQIRSLIATAPDPLVPASAAAGAGIFEIFRLTGSGTLTAAMSIDGIAFVLPGTEWSIQASVCVLCFTGAIVEDTYLAGAVTDGADFESTPLSASVDFTDADGALAILGWELRSALVQGTTGGLVDLSSTANINFFTTGSLTATRTTNSFLSAPVLTTPPAMVPLPASAFVLIASLMILGAFGRRPGSKITHPG